MNTSSLRSRLDRLEQRLQYRSPGGIAVFRIAAGTSKAEIDAILAAWRAGADIPDMVQDLPVEQRPYSNLHVFITKFVTEEKSHESRS